MQNRNATFAGRVEPFRDNRSKRATSRSAAVGPVNFKDRRDRRWLALTCLYWSAPRKDAFQRILDTAYPTRADPFQAGQTSVNSGRFKGFECIQM